MPPSLRMRPGRSAPLGATWDGEGVNFAIFSAHATSVELCLFESPGDAEPRARIPLRERTESVWHVYLPDVRPGQRYGYRIDGPWEPEAGHRFNPAKLLIDPYALAVDAPVEWHDELAGETESGERDPRDSGRVIPRSVVVDPSFPWGDDCPPRTPWNRTVIYECHVKGMTARHPEVPEALRGRYLGLVSDPVLDHLTSLGITAVELLPIQQFAVEGPLRARGLTNYWGYNTAAFFAPEVRYATGGGGEQVQEFQAMVKAFHRVGIEVLLDVVYNHTAEGNHLGPVLSLRGADNVVYYHLSPEDRRHYVDFTGCGNTLSVLHPQGLQLVMDSLRYWVEVMHVDGFRFDLVPALTRGEQNAFLDVAYQDPVLRGVKLIAEPWDLGHQGYRLGTFPLHWAEWNDRYRDTVRRFWREDGGQIPELASRFSGSSDIFESSGRTPSASVNFVTCHDGFTLRDLVTYEEKHNEDNGEDNRDGHDANYSRNWGVEGPTDAEGIRRLRLRVAKNLLATLIFSQGVPMLSHGDEIGRTQQGNNNGYCQDNEITWLDWQLDEERKNLFAFTRRLLQIRRQNPVLRRRAFFRGKKLERAGVRDISWLRPDGREMTDHDWSQSRRRAIGMRIHGETSDDVDSRGRPLRGRTLLLLLNAGEGPVSFRLPPDGDPGTWEELVSTARPPKPVRRATVSLAPHSLVLLRATA